MVFQKKMYSSTTTTVRILLLLVLGFCSHSLRCPAEEITCISVRVKIHTDFRPSDTQWQINDAFTRDKIFSGGPYDERATTYNTNDADPPECVEKTGCYEYTISDLSGDGLEIPGYYEIYYDDNQIKRGEGDFGFLDHSPLFGEGCPTLKPSPSLHPSKSPSPSQLPSGSASAKPSASISSKPSLEPTESFKPTTMTAQPTSSPTDISVPGFAKDSLGRRRFPPPPLQSSEASYQPPPECNPQDESDRRLGCITFPTPEKLPMPDWVGKLVQTQPECATNKNGKNKKCDLNIPTSKNVVPINLKPASSGFDESNKMTLPGDQRTSLFVTSADVDSDDNVDILVANFYGTNQLYYNKGNGEFDDPIDICNESFSSLTLRIADIDGDGLKDIVCPDVGGSSHILWGKGNKEFTTESLPIGSDFASDVAFWDFDGDGLLDIVVATNNTAPNIILMNNGYRSFTLTPLPQNVPYTSLRVVCGDLDNDGDVDIIVGTSIGGEQSELFQNNGNGTFKLTNLPGKSGAVTDIGLIDMDDNGFLDIVLSTGLRREQDPNQILWNHGNYNFTVQDLPGGLHNTYSSNIGDVNGDGQLDLVFANGRSSPHLLLSYNGSNGFNVMDLPSVGSLPVTSTLADLDNNGLLDIVYGTDRQGIQALMNSPPDMLLSEDFLSVNFPGEPQDTVAIVAGPLDTTTSYLDIVVGNFRQPNQLVRIYDDGSDHKTILLPGGNLETSCIVLMHLNNDNAFDIFVGNINGPNQVLVNKGGGEFDLKPIADSDVPTTAAASGDMNNNGLMDVVIGNRRYRNQLLLNNGDGTFTTVDLPGDKLDETTSIALADFNEDKFLDIVVGNGYDVAQPNYLLMNNQNETFQSEELPGGDRVTSSIVIGDLYNHERLDIVVGNFNGSNYILHNKENGFEVKDLPGRSEFTNALALADMDGDGNLDIITSNGYTFGPEPNQIIVNRDGEFKYFMISSSVGNTRALAVLDLDKDGTLDVIFGNYGLANTYSHRSVCDIGAQLHGQSWCFECPQFMGRKSFFNQTGNACLECMPGHMQSSSSELCAEFPCQFGERSLGTNECRRCSSGTFYDSSVERKEDDPESWKSPYCVDCDPGQYSDWSASLIAIDNCFDCPPGTISHTGSSNCTNCTAGTFQSLPGQTKCIICQAGGYCDGDAVNTYGGGFKECRAGTYNDQTGKFDESACIECPAGTFSTEVRAKSSTKCLPCPKGSYTNQTGETQCRLCPLETFQPNEGETRCLRCTPGTYGKNTGLIDCSGCPFRLNSTEQSDTCDFCGENFYLNDHEKVDKDEMFKRPDKYCIECPVNAECPSNTTLQTMFVKPNFWRDSDKTATLYPCKNDACTGSGFQSRNMNTEGAYTYCKSGHIGPLCQVCVNKSEYFDSNGSCKECPSVATIGIPVLIILGIIGAIYAIWKVIAVCTRSKDFAKKISDKFENFSLQAKAKIVISFYQIIGTFHEVYGVTIESQTTGWTKFLQIFDPSKFYPWTCLGSMKKRLLLGGLWPFALVGACLGFGLVRVFFRNTFGKPVDSDAEWKQLVWMQPLFFTTILVYNIFPYVYRSTFDAIKCRSFDSVDATKEVSSYLIADWSLRCTSGGDTESEHGKILQIFWSMFAIWIVLMPLTTLFLLLRIRGSVRSQRISSLAEACSFLWRDYTREAMFWEVIDLMRKMILIGLIMFVDTEEGSDKILRLIIAIIFSGIYLSMLLYVRPYKRKEDQDLAFFASLLLFLGFTMGVILQQCKGDENICHTVVGRFLSYSSVSFIAIIMAIVLLLVAVGIIVVVGFNSIPVPTIKLANSGHEPIMDLPRKCKYHAFVSHVWSSGQDKTHAMVRKLELYFKGIKVWLDVVNLIKMEDLESAVEESAVFILMYTGDEYFKSRNCRREVYKAVSLQKPTIVLYEGDESVIEGIEDACLQYCNDQGPTGQEILNHILKDDPILWLGAGVRYFSTASVKVLSESILKKLPFYADKPDLISKGLTVEDELKPVKLSKTCTIMFSTYNSIAKEIAEEVQEMAKENKDVTVEDVENFTGVVDNDKPHFFLVYLHKDIFSEADGMLEKQVKNALVNGLQIILVHEKDVSKGGMPFDYFFGQTPRELIIPPLNLFGDIAINMYSFQPYREVSLCLVLCRMQEAIGTTVKNRYSLKMLCKKQR